MLSHIVPVRGLLGLAFSRFLPSLEHYVTQKFSKII